MQDLKKNRRKMNNKQMSEATNCCVPESIAEVEVDDLDRGCKCNHPSQNTTAQNTQHKQPEFECECHCKPVQGTGETCEPCQIESDVCVPNKCATQSPCCNPICPSFTTKNACPVAIEANRIFDALQFRVFTDATGPNGAPLFFDYEVVEVKGNVPSTGFANVTVDEVCMNYSAIEVIPGCPSVEDYCVDEVDDNAPCDTVFEYVVCPDRSATCCAQNKGQKLSYKERGLTVIVHDLVLELRGHCGCTKIVALAFPAIRKMGTQLCRVDTVEFRFNTLASRICAPASGRSFILRQDFRTSLTVDCISKVFISAEDCCGCNCDCDCYDLTIPSGIDLILCVEETVSVLINDQLIVLAESNAINPRVVDTFANVCSFPGCVE